MDADWIDCQRDPFLSRREKRWSMNSQRLEEIVAELMKPISDDGRRSFDMDLSSLLEEYLTEAGLHALAAEEESESDSDVVVPNFAEIALLLQQSAHIYGRKVDFLYKHVLHVSDTLQNSVQELSNTSVASDEPQTPSTSRRRRRLSTVGAGAQFAAICLEASAAASREPDAPRPPPTLPRMYIELEPRLITGADMPLYDYAAENIGLLSDFQVTWRLHDGMLVDELEGGSARGSSSLRPISLLELQAAIAAAAPRDLPPSPSPHDDSPPRDWPPPVCASTPLPSDGDDPSQVKPEAELKLEDESKPDDTKIMPPPSKRERKRRSNVKIDDLFNGSVKIVFGKDLMHKLKEMREFGVPEKWISNVVEKRKSEILSARKRKLHEPQPPDEVDAEFLGWSSQEGARARAALSTRLADLDSDDDGFFEKSSGGSDISDSSPPAPPRPAPAADTELEAARAEAQAWRDSILRRAVAAEARGVVDVRRLGAQVLDALPRDGARRFSDVLSEHAAHEVDVSRLMLTTLFLANAGNVEIVQGPPLSLNSFSVRLVSRDARLFSLASDDEQFLR